MKTISTIAATLVLVAASPVLAFETLTASFATPDGTTTTRAYSGNVHVTVTGVGQSLARRFNDAFYVYSPASFGHDSMYNQLTFGTSTLVARRPRTEDALPFIVGGLPGYSAGHVYSFVLDTGTTTPKQLHFGVSDGVFTDNTGSYTITIAVPEPASWALMIAGFALVGAALRRRGGATVVAA